MKGIHIGLVVIVILAYLFGVYYPAPGQMVLSKVGLS